MACLEASMMPLLECWVGPSVPRPAASVDGALLQVMKWKRSLARSPLHLEMPEVPACFQNSEDDHQHKTPGCLGSTCHGSDPFSCAVCWGFGRFQEHVSEFQTSSGTSARAHADLLAWNHSAAVPTRPSPQGFRPTCPGLCSRRFFLFWSLVCRGHVLSLLLCHEKCTSHSVSAKV